MIKSSALYILNQHWKDKYIQDLHYSIMFMKPAIYPIHTGSTFILTDTAMAYIVMIVLLIWVVFAFCTLVSVSHKIVVYKILSQLYNLHLVCGAYIFFFPFSLLHWVFLSDIPFAKKIYEQLMLYYAVQYVVDTRNMFIGWLDKLLPCISDDALLVVYIPAGLW